ncbi:MAG: TlpA family protein disulfide reductase [Rhodocyclaceae bacterium]|nr:TlpA family protein disulfide reductase [Rhodocyclaceae bacterium]
MSRFARRLFIAALLVAAGVAGWLAAGGPPPLPRQDAALAEAGPLTVDQFYALSFADAKGTPRQLSEWRGKVLVVNFWATWCPPCRKEIPDFAAVSEAYAGRNVQFVGLGVDTAANVARFAAAEAVPYPLLVAGTGSLPIMASLGNPSMALPFTLIVAPDGRIARRTLGPMDGKTLENALEAMLSG